MVAGGVGAEASVLSSPESSVASHSFASSLSSHPRKLNSSNTASRAAVLKSAVANTSLAESLITSSSILSGSSGIGSLLDGIDGMDDIQDESNYVDVDVDSICDDIGQFQSLSSKNGERTDVDVSMLSQNNLNESILQIQRNIGNFLFAV